MTGEIETAFAAALATLNLAASIHRGTDAAQLPNEGSAIIAECRELEHTTPALWRGQVAFTIDSPAITDDLAAHQALEKAIDSALGTGAIKAAFASSALDLVGLWVANINSSTVDNRWIKEFICNVGLRRI